VYISFAREKPKFNLVTFVDLSSVFASSERRAPEQKAVIEAWKLTNLCARKTFHTQLSTARKRRRAPRGDWIGSIKRSIFHSIISRFSLHPCRLFERKKTQKSPTVYYNDV